MTLLAPWALWFASIGAAVIALYVLKIKRRQQVVPALEFWRELAGRTKVHSLFERLRRLLSMLLWLVIAACLVLALGNPLFAWGKIKPRAIAIVIDNSASMQSVEAAEQSKTRLQLAREAVRDLTTRRPVNDQWLLIEAAREPRVLQAWTHDHKSINAAAEDLAPFDGTGDLSAAVDLAGELLTDKSDPCIVIVSDGTAGKITPLLSMPIEQLEIGNALGHPSSTQPATSPANHAVILHWPIGITQDNLGIAQLSVRLHRQQSSHYAYVRLVNSFKDKIDTQLTIEIDGVTNSVEPVSIDGQSAWEKTIVIDAPNGGVLRASIDRADALTIDNEAFAILQPIKPAIVWLVTPDDESFFFEQALAAMDPLVWTDESLTLSPEQFEKASASLMLAAKVPGSPSPTTEPSMKKPDLVIFNNCDPKSLPSFAECVLVNSWPAWLPAKSTGTVDMPQLFIAPKPHPLTQYLNLQGVRLKQARRVSFSDRATVLAHSGDADPLIFLCEQGQRQILCIAFDIFDSDMPFRNAFPLLLRNAVSFMHAEHPAMIRPEYKIGETIRSLQSMPGDVKEVDVQISRAGQKDAALQQVPIRNGAFVWTDTLQCGAVRMRFGEDSCFTAINLADAAESQIAPTLATSDPASQLGLSRRMFGTMPWIGFAAAAAILLAAEWLTFHFRWTE